MFRIERTSGGTFVPVKQGLAHLGPTATCLARRVRNFLTYGQPGDQFVEYNDHVKEWIPTPEQLQQVFDKVRSKGISFHEPRRGHWAAFCVL